MAHVALFGHYYRNAYLYPFKNRPGYARLDSTDTGVGVFLYSTIQQADAGGGIAKMRFCTRTPSSRWTICSGRTDVGQGPALPSCTLVLLRPPYAGK
jgi:hypothetical protein